MKRKYRQRAGAISIELRRLLDLCNALDKEMSEDATDDGGDDDDDYVNFSDGIVYLEDTVNCFVAFEPKPRRKKQ